jgi:hypothetical protein
MSKQQTPIEDVNAQIERELAAQVERELEAELARKRLEIARRLRREAEMREYDRINRKHPIEDKYGGLGPEGHAKRLAIMDAGRRADMESMDRSNARPIPGSLAATRADRAGGSMGFASRVDRDDDRA